MLATMGGTPVRSEPFPAWPIQGEPERSYLLQALESGAWSSPEGGTFVRRFEAELAGLHRTKQAMAVTNGTASLVLSLRALGIGSGDEVIVPAYTFIATAAAALEVNALPIFVDIDSDTFCIDPAAVEAAITERTRAIIPAYLGGQPADLDRLSAIASRHGLAIVEDAAHAHGAIWNGIPVGGWGALGCFSMQMSKNLTGGEGGAVITNDDDLAERIRSLRNGGRAMGGTGDEHPSFGGSVRMAEFQAAVLCAQIERYPEQLVRRDANGRFLNAELASIDGIRPQQRDSRTGVHAYHLYSVRYDAAAFGGLSRRDFCTLVGAEGIPIAPGYTVPLNRQPVFANHAFDKRATGYDPGYAATQYGRLDLPACQLVCDEADWIPQTVLLGTERDMGDVVTAIRKVREAVNRLGADACWPG